MDAMQVLAYKSAMGHAGELRSALPGAPTEPPRERERVRARLAHTLRWTADRLDPVAL
ncbi:hypothetical protein AB0B45_03510 [Nonomuraea sp. NPDC049152]|uniref:hypothetical protein n=1 Tax=Nonomuraea sp. NPDC049152 TaxID=3154350 RepID=UPI0033DD3322